MNRTPSDSSARSVPQNPNGPMENPGRVQHNNAPPPQQQQRPPALARGAHFHPPPLNLVPPQHQIHHHFPQQIPLPPPSPPPPVHHHFERQTVHQFNIFQNPHHQPLQPHYVMQAQREQQIQAHRNLPQMHYRGHRQHQHSSRAYGQPYVYPSTQARHRHMQQQYHHHHRPPALLESPQYVQEHLRLQAQHPPLLRPPVLQIQSLQQQQQQQQRYHYVPEAPPRMVDHRQHNYFAQRQQPQHQHHHQQHQVPHQPQHRQQQQPLIPNTRYLEQLLATRPLAHPGHHHYGRNVPPAPAPRPALVPNFPAVPTQAIVQPRYPRELVGFNYVTDENGKKIKVVERNGAEQRIGDNLRHSNQPAVAVNETQTQEGQRESSPEIEVVDPGPAPKLNLKTGKMEGGAGICKEVKDKSRERYLQNQKRMNAIIDGGPLGYRPTVVSIERHQALRRQVNLLTNELQRQMSENMQVRKQCKDKLDNFKESSEQFHKTYDDLSKKSCVTSEKYDEMVEKYYQEMKAKMVDSAKADKQCNNANERDKNKPCTSRQALQEQMNQNRNMNVEEIQVQIKQEPLTPPPGNSGRNSEVPSLDEEAKIAQALADGREMTEEESAGLMVVYHSQNPPEEFEQFEGSTEARAYAQQAELAHPPDIHEIEADACADMPMEFQQEQYYVPEEPYAYHPPPEEPSDVVVEYPNEAHHHMPMQEDQVNPVHFMGESMDTSYTSFYTHNQEIRIHQPHQMPQQQQHHQLHQHHHHHRHEPHHQMQVHSRPQYCEVPRERHIMHHHYDNHLDAGDHHFHQHYHVPQQQHHEQPPLMSPAPQFLRAQLQNQQMQMALEQNQQGCFDGALQMGPPAVAHQVAPTVTPRRRRSAPVSQPMVPHHHHHHHQLQQQRQQFEYVHQREGMLPPPPPPPRAPPPPPLQYHGHQRVPTPMPPRMHRSMPERTASSARSHQSTQYWVPNPEHLLRSYPDLFKQYEMYHRMRANGLNPPIPEDLQDFFHGLNRHRRPEPREARVRRRQIQEEDERHRQCPQAPVRRTQSNRRSQMITQDPIQPNIEIPDDFPPHTHLRNSHNVLLCGGGVVELKPEPDPVLPSVSNAVSQGWLEGVETRSQNREGRNVQDGENIEGRRGGRSNPAVEHAMQHDEEMREQHQARPFARQREEVFADVEMMIKQHQDEQEIMAEQMLEVNYDEERGEPRPGCSHHQGNERPRRVVPPFTHNPGTSKLELLLQAAERALESHQMVPDDHEDDPDALVIDESVVINDVGIHGNFAADEEAEVRPVDEEADGHGANRGNGENEASVPMVIAEEPEGAAEVRVDIVDNIMRNRENEGSGRREQK